MSNHGFTVGPRWPASLASYAYLSGLANPDWAWEFLRRSGTYSLEARRFGYLTAWQVPGAVSLRVSRLRRRQIQAEAWGLSCFRSARPGCAERSCCLERSFVQPRAFCRGKSGWGFAGS